MAGKRVEATKIVAYMGIDWADKEHQICMTSVNTGEVESFKLKQEPDALVEWVSSLRRRFGDGKIAVAIEQRKGALINALMSYDNLILYPINPTSLASYRKAFSISGAKDDPVDAELLMDMVRLHREKLREWVPESSQIRLLQMLVETRRELVDQVTELTNRLQSTLKQYYPQALEWAGDLKSPQALDFLARWPTFESLHRTNLRVVEKFYYEHGFRNKEKVGIRLESIRKAKRLTGDRAVVTASKMKVQAIVGQLRPLIKAIAEYDEKIAEVFEEHPDHELFSSFPCAKEVLGPRLMSAFGTDRRRWDSALEIQTFSGIAPVSKKSGASAFVEKRLACPKFLRQTFQEYANQSMKKSKWARTYYQQLRARGMKHQAAVRSLAYKWIRIMYRCWQDQEPYCEAKYLEALKRRNSPLAALFQPSGNACITV